MSKKNLILIIAVVLVVIILGAVVLMNSQKNNGVVHTGDGSSDAVLEDYDSSYSVDDIFEDGIPQIAITFGYDGDTYVAELEDNETAIELARNITTSGRNLPIYNYDDFDGYEYFQYYDIPSSYKIPSNPVTVTSEKAGEIYYSSPNRVILFYQDANIEGNYTKIGEIKDITGLKSAVEENPVLQGWGNKIVSIKYVK